MDGQAHVLGTGGAIHAQHINRQRLKRGQSAGDIGAEEHAPAHVQRDLHLQRDALPACAEVAVDAVDGGFDLEDVLAGLQQQQVGAALDQAPRLLVKEISELVKADVAEVGIVARWQLAAGSHAAGHKARQRGFTLHLVASGAGDPRGGAVDLERLVAQPVLGQREAITAEGVGLDGFGADAQERFVNLADDIRAGDDEIVDTVLVLLAAEVGRREIVGLDAGAHGAVEDDDMVVNGVEIAPVAEGLRRVFHSAHDSRWGGIFHCRG